MQYTRRIVPFLLFLAAGAAFTLWPHGVKVVIHNTGKTPMHGVQVRVTGHSYPVDDIVPGEIGTVRVNPAGESNITLNYNAANDVAAQLIVDCYLEHNYSGTITIDAADGVTMKVTNGIRLGAF